MDANFLHYSIYNRFLHRQPCACVRKLFLLENSLKQLTRFLPNLTGTVP